MARSCVQGHRVDFRNTVIILTSNLGAQQFVDVRAATFCVFACVRVCLCACAWRVCVRLRVSARDFCMYTCMEMLRARSHGLGSRLFV